MSEQKPTPPNYVPEEDLNLHENFVPIIAENGLIRQPKKPKQGEEDSSVSLTRIDTLQDLIQIRQAEKKEKTLPPQPVLQELAEQEQTQPLPEAEHTFAISNNPKPQVDLTQDPAKEEEKMLPAAPGSTVNKTNPAPENTKEESIPSALPTVVPAIDKDPGSVKKPKNRKKSLLFKKRTLKKRNKDAGGRQSPPNPPASNSDKRNFSRYWPWVVVILCFLFLGGITGLVPVEKIPLLRNLAYAMGFSKDDTARLSFLRALLTWTDKTIGLPGDWSDDPSRVALFARTRLSNTEESTDANDASGLNAGMFRDSGQTSLISMDALHKLQLEKGRPLDSVRGAVMPAAGQDQAQAGPAQLRDGQVVVRTESNRVQGDVFFGSDASVVNRDSQDGFDSSKTLTKIKNPYITDGKPIDWLVNMTQKMVRATNSLTGVDRELSNTKVNWNSSVVDVGDGKEHRDLYHAWITSRMSKYTQNNMLKKALADSSFLGAQIPSIASNVLVFGGIQVDADSFAQDQKEWKEYLEFERKCKESLNSAGQTIQEKIDTFNTRVQDSRTLGFPPNCYEALDNPSYDSSVFSTSINTIEEACKDMNVAYQELEDKCYLRVTRSPNTCSANIRTQGRGYWNRFVTYCEGQFDTYLEKWYNEYWWYEYCRLTGVDRNDTTAKEDYWRANRTTLARQYKEGYWENEVRTQRRGAGVLEQDFVKQETNSNFDSMRSVVIDEYGGSSDYFPTEAIRDGGFQETVSDQLRENKTL